MGIKGLWTVLTPYSEKKSLHEVSGETLAVDLAGWVCDSQNVTDYYVQPKLYLRNLFFRTVYLVLADIKPIFVLEGDAPELKQDVMAARNAIQFRGAAPRTEPKTSKRPDVGRKRFKGVLRECELLLKSMGVSCVKGHGEAEATCAILNAHGVVDAVISQDSDTFAYGASRVYRNFSVSNAAGGGALQGSVDCYDAGKMFEQNGFGRNKMVALALLCGCDYGAGACGTSIATVLGFLQTVSDTDVIPRLLSWVTEPKHYETQTRWLSVPGRCDRCGHAGRTHAKNGCPVCVTNKGCEDTGHKTKMAEVKRELGLRTRALNCGAPFPEPKVMKEFLNRPPETVTLDDLKPAAPSLIQFIKLMTSKLDWSEKYCVIKFLPVLTKYHLQALVPSRTLKPLMIKKKRVPRGVPSFEVVWSDISGQYEGLIPDDQFEDDEDPTSPWTTTERQDLMRQYYPQIVEEFEERTNKPVKEKKPRAKKTKEPTATNKPKRNNNNRVKKLKDEVENLSKSLINLNISQEKNSNQLNIKNKLNKKVKMIKDEVENLSRSLTNLNISKKNNSKLNISVKVNRLKRKQKNKSQKTIESFLKNKKRKTLINSLRNNLSFLNDDEFNKITQPDLNRENDNNYIHCEKENDDKNYINLLDSSCEDIDESDLSDIVEKILNKAPKTKTATFDNKLVRLVFGRHTPRKSEFRKSVLYEINKNCSTPIQSPARKKLSVINISDTSLNASKANTSHFFEKLTEDCDAFEMSMDF